MTMSEASRRPNAGRRNGWPSGRIAAPIPRGLPVDLVVAVVGLASIALVAFPTFGPLKLADVVLPIIAVRALARRPSRFTAPLAGIVAMVIVSGLIGVSKAGVPRIDVIGDWATGLESPSVYPAITAIRICFTAIACFEIIWILTSLGARAQRAIAWMLAAHLVVSVLVFVAGPGRDHEGQIRGTFNERGPLARYTIVLAALLLLVRKGHRVPGAMVFVLALVASLPSLAGVALTGLFGGAYVVQRLNLRLRRTTPIVLGIVGLLILAALPRAVPLVQEKAMLFSEPLDDRPANGRYAAVRLAPAAVAASPFVGYGLGGFIFVRDSVQFGSKFARIPHDGADSPFIALFVDFGVFGGLFMALLIVIGPVWRRPGAVSAWPWAALNLAMVFTGSLETPLLWVSFAMASMACLEKRVVTGSVSPAGCEVDSGSKPQTLFYVSEDRTPNGRHRHGV